MKSSYIPMMLLVGVAALFALMDNDKDFDKKLVEVSSNEPVVAPVPLSELHKVEEAEINTTDEEEVIFKCRKEVAAKVNNVEPTKMK